MLIEITRQDARRIAKLCDIAADAIHADANETGRTSGQGVFIDARRLQIAFRRAAKSGLPDGTAPPPPCFNVSAL